MNAVDSFSGRYRFLSNFSPAEVDLDGVVYPTLEHAYAAAKTLDTNLRRRVLACSTPGHAKVAGRRLPLRADWEDVKLDVMEALLRKKFALPDLRAALLATAPRELIEGNNWGDRFWGVCEDRGENHLGRLLMKIRSELLVADLV